ncbi:CTP-dependent diacylglycerol kinase 1 [Grifola frondosa]|uniref:CTP-dependent diacylglycerol kinase 1 n=1 Tax=Grifola frondosa TaxID=5627 RepID=A0A1C7LNJ8_GRIFR|nr:CTP-dependent diacylglycerol kinase 1 [Grifola frondosa]
MTLPANDAFTLGLPHDPTRPSYSLNLRSSSTKIPFVSGSKTRSATKSPSRRRSMTAARSDLHAHPPTDTPLTSHASHHEPPLRLRRNVKVEDSKPIEDAKQRKKQPVDWEIPRKILHSSIGFVTLYLYYSDRSPRVVVYVLSLALAVIVPADVLRLSSPQFEKLYERCLGFLMRECEKKTTNGVIWYIIGVIFVLSVYPLDIAVVSILILSWADTAASTFGRLWGSLTPAPSLATSPFSIFLLLPESYDGSQAGKWLGLSVLTVVSGLVSGVAEALDLGSLDDNLTLPIISGGCIWGFFKILEFFSS